MADSTAWQHFEEIKILINKVNHLGDIVRAIAKEFHRLKSEVVDNPDLRAELKKILDEHPNITLEYIQEQYNKYLTLFQYLQDNGYL